MTELHAIPAIHRTVSIGNLWQRVSALDGLELRASGLVWGKARAAVARILNDNGRRSSGGVHSGPLSREMFRGVMTSNPLSGAPEAGGVSGGARQTVTRI